MSPGEAGDRPAQRGSAGALPPGEEVLAVHADVVEGQGRFAVHLTVLLASGAVRRCVGDYPDRRRAEIAAREVVRNATRHVPPAPRPG